MSNISVNTITDASGGSTASINGLTPQASNMQPFNRIINGAMTVDQRNAGASTIVDNNYNLDRWICYNSQASKLAVQQSSTAPTGFTKSMLFTSQSAYSVTSNDYFYQSQRIEGNNIADLGWGTASAQTVTLSFWVRSSLTGTFGGVIKNASQNRSYPLSYTISAANTWEQKSITVVGDTSGTWSTDTGTGIWLAFSLGCGTTYQGTPNAWSGANKVSSTGAVDVVATSGATFYITGVQLEAGSTASSFAHENVGDTLRKCQRYYQFIGKTASGNDVFASGFTTGTQFFGIGFLKTTMRAAPALSYTGSISDFGFTYPAAAFTVNGISATTTNPNSFFIILNNPTGVNSGFGSYARITGSGTALTFDSEL